MSKKNRAEKRQLRRMEQKRVQKSLGFFGVLCLLILTAVMVLHIVLPDEAYSASEKRNLALLPDLNLKTVSSGEFMAKADSYAADQFPLRAELMRIRTNLTRFLGETESQGVFYCQDGSLIEAFSAYDAEKQKSTAAAVTQFLQKHEFRTAAFLLIPSAVTLYPEKLPLFAETVSERDYIKAFTALLPDTLQCPDLESVLLRMKEEGKKVYYETDHHWTMPAAYRVFGELAEDLGWKQGEYTSGTVSNSFLGSLVAKSGFSPARSDEIVLYENADPASQVLVIHMASGTSKGSFYEPAALKSADQYEVFLGGNEPVLQIQTTADTDDTLLVFKDSYANCFLPFLADSYKTITVIDPRYYTDSVETLFLQSDYTDVLFLYSALTLSQDESLRIVLEEEP